MTPTSIRTFSAVLALALATACTPAPADETMVPADGTAAPVVDPNAVSGSLRSAWAEARLNLKESSEQMEADGYAFKPTPEVRSFGEILTHVAGANYTFCSAARGEASPNGEGSFDDITDRADVMRVLEESLVYCDAAYEAATDATLADTVEQPFNAGPGPRSAALINNVGHLNEHYGNLVTYFRLNGLVPPSSRR